MSYTRNKRNLPVGYKACPKCKGVGRVPCDGKEHFRRRYMAWAMSFHMKPVVYTHQGYSTPGLAVATVQPGGWWCLDIYIGINNQRHSYGRYDRKNGVYIYSRTLRKRSAEEYANFDFLSCRAMNAERVKPLDFWPQHLLTMPTFELGELDSSGLLTDGIERG